MTTNNEGRQFYTEPSREGSKWALPDAETFRVRRGDRIESEEGDTSLADGIGKLASQGASRTVVQ